METQCSGTQLGFQGIGGRRVQPELGEHGDTLEWH